MESYFRSERDIRLVVQLLDIRHAPTEDDLQMVNFLIDSEIPFLIALTKCDKLKKSQREGRIEAMRGELPCAEQLTVLPVAERQEKALPELQKILEEIAEETEREKNRAPEPFSGCGRDDKTTMKRKTTGRTFPPPTVILGGSGQHVYFRLLRRKPVGPSHHWRI